MCEKRVSALWNRRRRCAGQGHRAACYVRVLSLKVTELPSKGEQVLYPTFVVNAKVSRQEYA